MESKKQEIEKFPVAKLPVHARFGFGAGMDFYEGMTNNPMAYDLTPEQMQREMGLRESFSHQEVTSPRATISSAPGATAGRFAMCWPDDSCCRVLGDSECSDCSSSKAVNSSIAQWCTLK